MGFVKLKKTRKKMLRNIANSRTLKIASKRCFVASSSRSLINVNLQKSYHTTACRCEEFVEIPQKGKVVLPEKIKKIGDDVLSLNVLESIMLQQYLRVSNNYRRMSRE